jgi:hypothetical protein
VAKTSFPTIFPIANLKMRSSNCKSSFESLQVKEFFDNFDSFFEEAKQEKLYFTKKLYLLIHNLVQ